MAICNGAATIVTGFATGAAGAYGIGLKNETEVKLNDTGKTVSIVNGQKGVGEALAHACVTRVLEEFGVEYGGAKVTTVSDVPHAAGLKSSSIAANAMVLATVGALASERGCIRDLRLSKSLSEQAIMIDGERIDDMSIINMGIDAAFEANVTKTGAIDDASAAYFGGYALTKNHLRSIERRGEMEDLQVSIYLPDERIYSAEVSTADVRMFAKEVDMVWEAAMAGRIYEAINLNGLLHCACFGQDMGPALAALDCGALACGLSGTGPSIVALSHGGAEDIAKSWAGLGGRVIDTRTSNEKARIVI